MPDVVRRPWPAALPFYYGWVNVVVASLAMTATLPGRTHGLGLITEPVLVDFNLDRLLFAKVNLLASVLGAAFSIPTGWLIDRYGVRSVLAGVTLALAASVLGMSECRGTIAFAVMLMLLRGLGQSALSVASMAAIGKWFDGRLGAAMGTFAVLLTIGFIGGVLSVGQLVTEWGWREAWRATGLVLLALAACFWAFARSAPQDLGVRPDPPLATVSASSAAAFSLRQALTTSAFWAMILASSFFNLAWSGLTLFNESLLAEHGLGQKAAVQVMAILTGVGLIANLWAGKLITRDRVAKLMGVGMLLLAVALMALPTVGGLVGARLYATALGLSGGIVTVVFFAAWRHLFGPAELGRIHGAAQFATVLASAIGPWIIAEGFEVSRSYGPLMIALAMLATLLGLASLLAPKPQ